VKTKFFAALSAVALIAAVPSIAHVDAAARALGNRKAVAVAIGDRLFQTEWPAQVLNVEANQIGPHVVVGLRLSGVHFHQELTQAQFEAEVAALVARSFQAAPSVEEVDVWAGIPLAAPKGAIVAGDLAVPTWRTVFTVSVRRGESSSALAARLREGKEIYLDEDWMRSAFKRST
jgi:hypothetical protein